MEGRVDVELGVSQTPKRTSHRVSGMNIHVDLNNLMRSLCNVTVWTLSWVGLNKT